MSRQPIWEPCLVSGVTKLMIKHLWTAFLSRCQLKSYGTIGNFVEQSDESVPVKIYIKCVATGALIELDVFTSNTIEKVKTKIAEKMHILEERQRLFFDGKLF